jgi:NAD+ synthase (glutamine-hydrolysing)
VPQIRVALAQVNSAGTVVARGPQFDEALIVVDLELPSADQAAADGDTTADARDGSVMTIRRLTVSALPLPETPTSGDGADAEPRAPWPRLDDLAEVYAALALWVRPTRRSL